MQNIEMRQIFDKNEVQLKNNSIVDLHQTVNGQNLFVVLDVDTLDVRYYHDLSRKYEYDVEELFRACQFSGEVDFEIVGTLADFKLKNI
jgi:ribosomal silencing factor RsfS